MELWKGIDSLHVVSLVILFLTPSISASGRSAYCNNHGDWAQATCHCYTGWTGNRCQYAIKTCGENSDDGTIVTCVHGTCTEHMDIPGLPGSNLGDFSNLMGGGSSSVLGGDTSSFLGGSDTSSWLDGSSTGDQTGSVTGVDVYWTCDCELNWHGDRCDLVGPATPSPPATPAPPLTPAPHTAAPTTKAPPPSPPRTTKAPTAAPTTKAPTTAAPTTEAPTTKAPTTKATTTEATTTPAPTTTESTTTPRPTTRTPPTPEQTTRATPTLAQLTRSTSTRGPTSEAPTTQQATNAPSTTQASTTTAQSTTLASTVLTASTTVSTASTIKVTTSTSTTPLTTQTTTIPTTTPLNIEYSVCDGFASLADIAKHLNSTHPDAVTCPLSGSHMSHEAFVLNHCPSVSKTTSTWQAGESLGSACDSIPRYTAVAAFYKGAYSAADSLSGIFLKCLPDGGFEMGVQLCEKGTALVTIDNDGVNLLNSNAYFTIQAI